METLYPVIKSAFNQPKSVFVFLPHMFLNIRKDVLCEMPPNRTEDDAVCILNWASTAHFNSYIKKKNSYADIHEKSIF